jgi:hypothetical protein
METKYFYCRPGADLPGERCEGVPGGHGALLQGELRGRQPRHTGRPARHRNGRAMQAGPPPPPPPPRKYYCGPGRTRDFLG